MTVMLCGRWPEILVSYLRLCCVSAPRDGGRAQGAEPWLARGLVSSGPPPPPAWWGEPSSHCHPLCTEGPWHRCRWVCARGGGGHSCPQGVVLQHSPRVNWREPLPAHSPSTFVHPDTQAVTPQVALHCNGACGPVGREGEFRCPWHGHPIFSLHGPCTFCSQASVNQSRWSLPCP